MSFYWPHLLWLLLIPLAILVRDVFRRRTASVSARPKIQRAVVRNSSLALVPLNRPAGGKVRLRIYLCLGLTCALLALARPQWGRIEEPVFDQSREILIALDLSRSMLADDVKPSRLDRAKLLITSLLERLAGERVGLVVFSGTAFLQSPLSSDYEILREFLPTLNPDYLPEGGTDYDALIDTALAAFGASNAADRYLIILSDGEAQTEDWRKHLDALKTKGIRILGLGIGTDAGAMIPDGQGALLKDDRGAVVLSKLNSSTLRDLSDQTGGVYSDASSWVDLAQLIQATVEQGRRGEFKESSRIRLAERFQWALAPALLFFLLSYWRDFPVRPRPRSLALAGNKAAAPAAASAAASASPPPLPTAVAALPLALFSLFAASLFAPAPASAASPAAPPADPLAAPLQTLVGRLSAHDAPTAADYAELARTTISYAESLKSSQQPPPAGALRDALAATDAGAALDPKAADWPALRDQLNELGKTPPPPPPQDQQKPEDQPKQDSKSDDAKNSDSKNQKGGGDQPQSADKPGGDKTDPTQKKPSDPSKDESAPPSGNDPKKDPAKDDASADSPPPSKDEKPSNQQKQQAFGDMKPPAEKPAPPPGAPAEPAPSDPGEMQQVGGAPEKKEGGEKTDPALTVPLQRLDQVRDQDSPARLFQLLNQDQAPAPAKKGQNW